METIKVFVDGSFCQGDYRDGKQQVHGGFVIWDDENRCPLQELHVNTTIPELVSMRNVGGELLASFSALFCIVAGISDDRTPDDDPINIKLIYDYEGIGKWLTGEWKARKPGTQWYLRACEEILNSKPNLFLEPIWVKGHAGNYGNSKADLIASYTECYANANNIEILELDNKENLGF